MTVTSDTDTWMLTDVQLTARVALAFKTKARAEAACAALVTAVQDVTWCRWRVHPRERRGWRI